jgi:hypothetical protein
MSFSVRAFFPVYFKGYLLFVIATKSNKKG